jgi:hypothetical protein
LELQFGDHELAAIDDAVPDGSVAGTRYGAAKMADLESER